MPKILNIPEETLKDLYLIQKLSSRKIAKTFNCAYSTIDRKIHLLGLPIRNLSQAHIIYERKNFSGHSEEKAYLIGFRIGDLRVRKFYKNSETIIVDCGSTKNEQIDLIKNLFSPYGHIWISQPKHRNKRHIQCHLNESFSFLLNKNAPKNVFNNQSYFFSFLAGFTDAEGSIFISKSQNQAHYSLGNYNLKLLQKIQSSLAKFNISSPKIAHSPRKGLLASHGYRYNHDYWTLVISKKTELINFFKLISPYLKHQNRIKQMKTAINNIEERNKLYGSK